MELSVKTGRAQKIHIYIDGEYKMTVDSNFWYSEKWHNFNRIDEEELAELECSVNSRRAFLNGMSLLSRHAHSKKEIITNIKWSDNELENKKIILLMLFKLIYDRGQMSLDEELLYLKNRYAKTSSKHLGFLNKDLERRNKEDFGEKKEEENKNVTFNQINNFTHFCIEYDKAKGILKKNDTESIPDNIIDVEPL